MKRIAIMLTAFLLVNSCYFDPVEGEEIMVEVNDNDQKDDVV